MNSKQFQILLYLIEKEKTTINDIAKHFELHRRTIERNINALISWGLPITTTQGRGGGVEIDSSYRVDQFAFTKKDFSDLVMAHKIFTSLFHKTDSERLLAGVALLNPSAYRDAINTIENYVEIDIVGTPLEPNPQLIQGINTALVKNQFINVTLTTTTYEVLPIKYVLKPTGLHLYAWSERYVLINLDHIKEMGQSTRSTTDLPSSYASYFDNDDIELIE